MIEIYPQIVDRVGVTAPSDKYTQNNLDQSLGSNDDPLLDNSMKLAFSWVDVIFQSIHHQPIDANRNISMKSVKIFIIWIMKVTISIVKNIN